MTSQILVEIDQKKKVLRLEKTPQEMQLKELLSVIKKAFSLDPDQELEVEYFNSNFHEWVDLDDTSDLPDQGIKLKVKPIQVTKVKESVIAETEEGAESSMTTASMENEALVTDIEIGSKLGGGAFGSVYSATWQGTTPVAAKKLHDYTKEKFQEFAQEAKILKKLRHPNCLAFYGVYLSPLDEYYLITEMCPHGNLRDLLLKLGKNGLQANDLIKMAKDAAAGMTYLSANHIVHRDLAARNLLVKQEADGYQVKVGDFGMSRNVDNKYYEATNTKKIAYKWTAPEAIKFGKYSTTSDVWSFGVTLYEIMSYGAEPYAGLSNREAIEFVTEGKRLESPEGCPKNIYDLMVSCWNSDPNLRPSFRNLYVSLNSFLEKGDPIPDVSVGTNNYVLESDYDDTNYGLYITSNTNKINVETHEMKQILTLIFDFLDPATLIRIRLVSKFWSEIAKSNSIWKKKCLDLFPRAQEIYRVEKDFSRFPKDGIDWWQFYWELLHEENLVLNPMFKSNSATWSCDGTTTADLIVQVKQWKQDQPGRDSMNWARTPEDAFIGKFCIKGKGGKDAFSKRIATSFNIRKNDVVVISAWVKAFTPNDARIFVQCKGGDYEWNESKSCYHSGSGNWELLQTSFGPVTSDTTAYFFLWNNSETSFAFFDHCFANKYFKDSEELKQLMTQLFEYAKNGNVEQMKALLTKNAEYKEQIIEAEDQIGRFTALYRAAQAGHLEVVKLLVDYGFDLESKRGDGSTPLYIACQEDRTSVVSYLISKGANIECVYKTGFRPMYISAQKGRLEVIKILVANGAVIDAASEEGATPLYIACQNNQIETVKFLISKGANLEAKFKGSFVPLYIAAQKGHLEICQALIEGGAVVDSKSADSATPLYIACQNGHREVADYLISKGANPEMLFKGTFPPIYIASQKGHYKVVELLIERGVKVDFRIDLQTGTPLYTAAQNGHLEVCKLLLDNGAYINAKYQGYYTPVYIAAQKGHVEVLKYLLDRGGDVDAPCSKGSTALFVASQNGHIECVKELIERGANPDIRYDNGVDKKTPLEIAKEKKFPEIEKLLEDYQNERKRKKNQTLLKQVITETKKEQPPQVSPVQEPNKKEEPSKLLKLSPPKESPKDSKKKGILQKLFK